MSLGCSSESTLGVVYQLDFADFDETEFEEFCFELLRGLPGFHPLSPGGDFLPEDQIATALLAADCDQALDTLMTAVSRHTGGHGHDDMALLLLEYDAYPHNSANGHPPRSLSRR